jgi:hypothetical protein
MKKKAIVIVLACIMVMAAIGIGNAAPGYYTCTISRSGAATYGYWIEASDINGAFSNTFFLIDQSVPNMAPAMYATALTAYANSSNVLLYVADSTPGSLIFVLAAAK